MSITGAMYTGVSGLLANAEGLNVIGNNLSNSNTIGFKGGRMLFSDLLSAPVGNNSQVGRGVQIQKVDNIFSQGSLESTTVVTDLAIQGDKFFSFAVPGTVAATAINVENAYYSRAGALRIDSDNRSLINPDGYVVLDENSIPVVFTSTYTDGNGNVLDFQKVTGVDAEGRIQLLYADNNGNSSKVYYAGNGAVPVATTVGAIGLGTARIPNPPGLEKVGSTLYKQTGNAIGGSGIPTITRSNGTNEKILSNNLELSNVDMATEMVKMILTQRAYSANSKTITTADEMTQEVLNLKR